MLPAAGGGETLLVLGSGCPELVLTVTFPTQQSSSMPHTGTRHRDYTLAELSPCQYLHQHWLFTSYLSTIRDHGLTEKIMHDYLTTIPRFTAETGWEHGRISINRHGGFHGISWATDNIHAWRTHRCGVMI